MLFLVLFFRSKYMLSSNVHVGLPDPNRCKETAVVEGEYKYYHYLCDGVNDVVSM